MFLGVPELRQEADAAGTDIDGWRIEQRAMIGKRNLIEIIFVVFPLFVLAYKICLKLTVGIWGNGL